MRRETSIRVDFVRRKREDDTLDDVGSGHVTTIHAFAMEIAAIVGSPEPTVTGQFRLGDVRRVLRPMGSPVIVVERTDPPVAFYFVEPPPLRFRNETSRKAKGRLKSISYLRARNRTKRDEVKRWVERIREATGQR